MQVPNSCGRLLHQMDQVSSIEHPQSNGQAKAFNKVILDELKNNLDKQKKHGSKLLGVLWAYRCIPQWTTKETLFWLAYGSDAMIPIDVEELLFQWQQFHKATKNNLIRIELDLVEEIQDWARIAEEACKQKMMRLHNSKMRPK